MVVSPLVVYGALALVGLVVGYLFYKADDKIEERRRNYLAVSKILTSNGFVQLPKFLDNLAIGDYDGALRQVGNLRETFQHPEQVQLEFDKVLERLVLKKAETADGKDWLVALLDRVVPGVAAKVSPPKTEVKASA